MDQSHQRAVTSALFPAAARTSSERPESEQVDQLEQRLQGGSDAGAHAGKVAVGSPPVSVPRHAGTSQMPLRTRIPAPPIRTARPVVFGSPQKAGGYPTTGRTTPSLAWTGTSPHTEWQKGEKGSVWYNPLRHFCTSHEQHCVIEGALVEEGRVGVCGTHCPGRSSQEEMQTGL